tara:strand:+ start:1725 stop:2414 length:690 start_codon:yes stop_codon:yes gene_type:complete
MVNINYSSIKQKLSKQLSSSGWDIVDRYIFSNEFHGILEHLVKGVNDNKRFTPKIKYLFRAFEECPYNKLKAVIVGQDPYPNLNVADGIGFSSSLNNKIPTSLNTIFNKLEESIDNYERNPDLTRWANQGILSIQTALTTQVDTIGSHYNLWKPFIKSIITYINDNNTEIVFVFMGEKANSFSQYVNIHPTIYCSHPASAKYKETWKANDVFININNKLKEFNKSEIIW